MDIKKIGGWTRMRPDIHVMLKPAGGLCNMRCRYCFYADEMRSRSVAFSGMMTIQTLKNVLRPLLAECSRNCSIAFQGGEPTLAGLDFFREAVKEIDALNVNSCRISYALQTNGLLIDEQWCEFLAEHRFLVGVSLDGTRELHDANRVDASGNGTFSRVMEAIRLLEKHRVDVNILTVLTGNVCRSYRKVHQFYKKQNFRYQQFIPCLDGLNEQRGSSPWSLTPKRYEEYLKTAFDCWYQQAMSGNKEYHRYFDNLLLILDRQLPEACGMAGQCGVQYVVESDGTVYPCDFYMTDGYRLGNLNTDTLEQIDAARLAMGFIQESRIHDGECLHCKWWGLCHGGGRRDRDYFEQGLGKNYYCQAQRAFFEYAYPKLISLYRYLKMGTAI